MDENSLEIERHPWPPFIPDGARLLVMGTFPPGRKRWSMDFYYPNPTNDFWRVMGLVYFNDKDNLYVANRKTFDLEKIKSLLTEHHIAMNDTGRAVRRLKGNASDKYLEIIEPVPLDELVAGMPDLAAIATTGEKAAQVIADATASVVPKVGEYADITTPAGRRLRHYRMPSTSRAYPLPLERKAAIYASMLRDLGL